MQGAPPSSDLSGLSTEELMRMRASDAPQKRKVGAVEDVVRSLPGSIPRAAAGLVGFPQTLFGLMASGVEKGATALGVSPQAAAAARPELGNVGDLVTKGYDKISEMVTGEPLHRPQTVAGRIADLTAQTLVSPGGTVGQKLAMGASAGAAGEGARLITDNPIAIGVVQLLGGGAASLPWILRSVPAENVHNAIKGITQADLAKAQALMDDAATRGVKLTGAEAISKVTGKNTLQDIQRVVESSKQGGPVVQGMMNERPRTVGDAFTKEADQIASMPANPAKTPVRMQQAAEQSITKARQAGNAAAEPSYEVARQQKISSQEWNSATQNPASLKALQAVKSDPIWGVTAEKEGSIAWLDAAKRWIDDKLKTSSPSEARIWQKANEELKSVADAASPAYKQARATISQNRQQVVDPMKASPVGDIANMKGLPAESAMKAQSDVLMPSAPRALDPMTIRETVKTLSAQDATASRDFVRQNLQAIFDEQAQNLSGGANQWGGAKFASQIAGNPRQKDNLQALIESTGGRPAWVGFQNLLDVLEATGKRHAPGSQTAFNQQLAGELSAGGLGAIPASIASPQKAMSLIGNAYDNFRFGKNTEEMARLLTDPRSVDLMVKLAKEAPGSAKASAIVAQILSANAATSNESSNTNR